MGRISNKSTKVQKYHSAVLCNTGLTLRKKQEEVVTYIKRPIMNAVRMNSERGKTER